MWYSVLWEMLSIHCFSLQGWSRSSFLVSVLQSLTYLWSLGKALESLGMEIISASTCDLSNTS